MSFLPTEKIISSQVTNDGDKEITINTIERVTYAPRGNVMMRINQMVEQTLTKVALQDHEREKPKRRNQSSWVSKVNT